MLTIQQVAQRVKVSEATIKNWVKQGILRPCLKSPILFVEKDIDVFSQKIQTGEIVKLRARANKTRNSNTILPLSYYNRELSRVIEQIVSVYSNSGMSHSEFMVHFTISWLFAFNECSSSLKNIPDNPEDIIYRRKSVQKIINDWLIQEQMVIRNRALNEIEAIITEDFLQCDDALGTIYQAITHIGQKSDNGSYYTPAAIVDDIVDDYAFKGCRIIDPCCGSGQFILRFAQKGMCLIQDIYGFDIDPISVKIASINLLMFYPEEDSLPNIFCVDTLSIDFDSVFNIYKDLYHSFDIVATNPPWGTLSQQNDYKARFKTISSGESFSYFIYRAFEFARDGGIISYILPESILNIKVHQDIRELMLRNAKLLKIVDLGKAFAGVFTGAVRIDMKKSIDNNGNMVKIVVKNSKYEISQDNFINNHNYRFDILRNKEIDLIIDKLYKHDYYTLKDNADWALGIVTGNNKKYLSDVREEGYEEIYRGCDVSKYSLSPPLKYILFSPEEYQQVAPVWKYRVKEKLVYRFISKRIVMAYDDQKRLTLNSANICIPKANMINMKIIAILFNSKLYNYAFSKLFNTHKILRSDLESLPIPHALGGLTDTFLDLFNKVSFDAEIQNLIDGLIYDFFDIDCDEIDIIDNFIGE